MMTLIAAVAQNLAIGKENKLLYWLPDDMKHFKAMTTGHTVIMGRKTFESLPNGALPNRRNVVLSRQKDFRAQGAEVFTSMTEALANVKADEEVFVIGGESIYEAALPLADRMCLTLVEDTPEEADAFFPSWNVADWNVVEQEYHEADDRHPVSFSFITLVR